MTDEELKNKMEFIVEQQAQFAVDIEQLKSVVARLANSSLRRFEKNDETVNDLDAKMAAMVDAQIRADDKISTLAESQAKTDNGMQHLTADMRELAQAQTSMMTVFEMFMRSRDDEDQS